ncbi:hypothetical protein [Amycolatopsis nigrescens]|uniref:hypothetical protein n=1 Tax=Amycolatopsis nigrescens TaxID=381445 RepID=UPI0012FC3EBC|nr:hypothetical protein [Amycolatopsis nigrescens]
MKPIDDGTSFLDGIGFFVSDSAQSIGKAAGSVAGAAGGGGAPGGGDGGFAMSRDEMTAMLTKAKTTRDLIQRQQQDAWAIAQSQPPGNDQASTQFTTGPGGANQVGEFYLGHLQVQYNRYTQLIEKLSSALGIVTESDHQAANDAQKAGGKYS